MKVTEWLLAVATSVFVPEVAPSVQLPTVAMPEAFRRRMIARYRAPSAGDGERYRHSADWIAVLVFHEYRRKLRYLCSRRATYASRGDCFDARGGGPRAGRVTARQLQCDNSCESQVRGKTPQ